MMAVSYVCNPGADGLGNDIRQVINGLAHDIFAGRTQYRIGKGFVAINKYAVGIPEKSRIGNRIYQI
jgi:hypothetical protein